MPTGISTNELFGNLSDLAVQMYNDLFERSGMTFHLKIERSVVDESDDAYEMYNVVPDKRTSHKASEYLKGILVFPSGKGDLWKTRKDQILFLEDWIPTKAYFRSADSVKESDIIIWEFGENSIKLEITSSRNFGIVKPILTECIVAVKRD